MENVLLILARKGGRRGRGLYKGDLETLRRFYSAWRRGFIPTVALWTKTARAGG